MIFFNCKKTGGKPVLLLSKNFSRETGKEWSIGYPSIIPKIVTINKIFNVFSKPKRYIFFKLEGLNQISDLL